MNKLQLFENPAFGTIRAIERDGEPWFVAADVCRALEIVNHKDAITRLDDDEKTGVALTDPHGREQVTNCINEPGMYALVLGSRKPEARAFKRWVTHEVIPAIRKTGLYATPEAAEKLLADPDFLIEALQEIKAIRAKNAALAETVSIQGQQISELQPKASYYDVVLQTKDAISITEIAKDYGRSAKWMNNKLHELGIQFRQGDIWLLYQKHAQMGYTRSKTHTYSGSDGNQHSKLHTYWTQKGRLYIYAQMRAAGILPIIERESAA